MIYRYEKDLIITANNQYQHQMKETSTQVKRNKECKTSGDSETT
jgi:hypothetical protein